MILLGGMIFLLRFETLPRALGASLFPLDLPRHAPCTHSGLCRLNLVIGVSRCSFESAGGFHHY